MAINIREEIQRYKILLNKLQSEFDKSTGALSSEMKVLKEKFGFNDVQSAKKQLKKYDKEIDDLEKNLNQSISLFQKKYKNILHEDIL
jgi:seryl-tRNA synthetase